MCFASAVGVVGVPFGLLAVVCFSAWFDAGDGLDGPCGPSFIVFGASLFFRPCVFDGGFAVSDVDCHFWLYPFALFLWEFLRTLLEIV